MSNGDIGYWTGSFTYTPSWSPGPISVNIGATDSNGVDWLWMQIAGWDSPPVVGQITQRAADHGGWPTEQYFAPRPLTLTIQASAPTQALRDAARAALQMAIPVSDFTLLTYNEPIPKQMLVRRSGQITESYPTLDDVQFQCVLISADPRKYTATSKLYTTSLAANQQVGLSLPFTLVDYQDTIGYWAMGDENAGIFPDSSPLGNNATVSGSAPTLPGPAMGSTGTTLTGAQFAAVGDFGSTSTFSLPSSAFPAPTGTSLSYNTASSGTSFGIPLTGSDSTATSVPAGAAIFVTVQTPAAVTITGVSDIAGNAYSAVTSLNNSSSTAFLYVWACFDCLPVTPENPSSNTITVTTSTSTSMNARAFYITNVTGVAAHYTNTGSTSATSPPAVSMTCSVPSAAVANTLVALPFLPYVPADSTNAVPAAPAGFTGVAATFNGAQANGTSFKNNCPSGGTTLTSTAFATNTAVPVNWGYLTLSLTPLTKFSLECWFNTSALANDVVLISGGSFTQTTFQGFNLILFTDNNIYFDWGNGTVRNRVATSGGPVTASTWHYVVATFDGTNSRIYLDGTLAATSGTFTGPMYWPTPSVGLAATYSGIGGNLFPVSLCAAAIYPSVLNATQVGLRYIQPLTWLPPQPSGSSGAVSVTNDGSFETRPVVTINGPIIAPSVTLNGTRTVSFSALTLVSGDKLVIDTDAKTGYLNGAYRSPDISSAWWVLEPGMSTLQLGGSTSGGAIMQVAYRDAWI